jgi:hypothetical protein
LYELDAKKGKIIHTPLFFYSVRLVRTGKGGKEGTCLKMGRWGDISDFGVRLPAGRQGLWNIKSKIRN